MKKKQLIIIGIIAIFSVCLIAFLGKFSQSKQVYLDSDVAGLAQEMQGLTKVPIELPTTVPIKKYYSAVTSIDTDHYLVTMEATPDCAGAHICGYGSVLGQVSSIKTIDEQFGFDREFKPTYRSKNPLQTVTLANGIEGRFIPFVCGANCSDSRIVWGENGYRYSISLRALTVPEDQEVQSLIDMANSAIANRK
jgi:hypothetical protein